MNNRAFSLLIVSMAIGLASVAGSAQVREIGGIGLTVFADRSFRGQSATFRDDVTNLQPSGLNDRVSSLRVGRGERWEVCEHAGYRGRCVVVSGSEGDLNDSGWNDVISSARRVDRPGGVGGIRPPVAMGLELFSRDAFGGDRRRFTGAESDLRRVSFNDLARSLRLAPREVWEVCVQVNFRDCEIVNADVRDLSRFNLARRISSVRPVRRGRGGPR